MEISGEKYLCMDLFFFSFEEMLIVLHRQRHPRRFRLNCFKSHFGGDKSEKQTERDISVVRETMMIQQKSENKNENIIVF